MRCPTLNELPPPPAGRTGWPWTEESPHLPDAMPDGSSWPRVSIVTPSYNQGRFIEETIRSVLLQGYPDLEYLIIDGGSTDESVEIIRRYQPWLAYWVSEPDRGQSHAINKGIARASGSVLAWLNSDDLYLPRALRRMVPLVAVHGWAVGAVEMVSERGELQDLMLPGREPTERVDRCFRIPTSKDFATAQPGHFWARTLWETVGFLNEPLHYRMDFEWMMRALADGHRPVLHPEPVASYRLQAHSKTVSSSWAFDLESARVFVDLACRGTLRFWPALGVSRGYLVRGLRGWSDALYQHERNRASFCAALTGWLLSGQIRGGGFWQRLRRHLPGSRRGVRR